MKEKIKKIVAFVSPVFFERSELNEHVTVVLVRYSFGLTTAVQLLALVSNSEILKA